MQILSKIAEFRDHAGPVYDLLMSPGSNKFYSCSGDRFVARWQADATGQDGFSIRLEEVAFAMGYGAQNKLLLLGTDSGRIHVIDLVKKVETRLLESHNLGVFCFEHVPSENWMISGGGKGVLNVWNSENMDFIRSIPLDVSKIRSIHHRDDAIWVAQSNGFITKMDLPYLNSIADWKAHEGGTYCIRSIDAKNAIVSGGADGMIRCWSENGKELYAFPAHKGAIYDLQMNEDYLFSCSRDKSIKVWDLNDLSHVQTIERPKHASHTHSINSILILDKNTLASAGDDRRIILWNISNGSK